jgi:hypothetical protein
MQRANRSSLMIRLKTWFAYSASAGGRQRSGNREHYIYDKELFVTTKYSRHQAFYSFSASRGSRRVTDYGSAVLTKNVCVQKNEGAQGGVLLHRYVETEVENGAKRRRPVRAV